MSLPPYTLQYYLVSRVNWFRSFQRKTGLGGNERAGAASILQLRLHSLTFDPHARLTSRAELAQCANLEMVLDRIGSE